MLSFINNSLILAYIFLINIALWNLTLSLIMHTQTQFIKIKNLQIAIVHRPRPQLHRKAAQHPPLPGATNLEMVRSINCLTRQQPCHVLRSITLTMLGLARLENHQLIHHESAALSSARRT
jgi:hypothetical protein